jgi:hypothetical protein
MSSEAVTWQVRSGRRSVSTSGKVVAGIAALAVLLGAASHALAQPAAAAAALAKALEGRHVKLLMDMPASSGGVDLHVQREPEIDAALHARRLADFGVAIRQGQTALVTKIKVNKKNIEIQLGGGGYGTLGDDDGLVIAKLDEPSPEQRDLERERKRTTDPQRKREIDRELNELREALRRQHAEAFRHARALTEINKREIARKRLDAGSRFNIWYQDKRLEQWAPTPEELLYSLASYLEVLPTDDGPPRSVSLPPRPMTGRDGTTALRRGMTTAEVYDALGFPSRRKVSPQGDLAGSVETWDTRTRTVEVTFVGGVVVAFTSVNK